MPACCLPHRRARWGLLQVGICWPANFALLQQCVWVSSVWFDVLWAPTIGLPPHPFAGGTGRSNVRTRQLQSVCPGLLVPHTCSCANFDTLFPATPVIWHLQVEALRTQVVALEAAVSAARGEYSRQAARNGAELAAFREQRGRELAGVMVSAGGRAAGGGRMGGGCCWWPVLIATMMRNWRGSL